MSKKRVWTKAEIETAFREYLAGMKLMESDDWVDLCPEEAELLYKWHFNALNRELMRIAPKRKADV